MVVSERALHLNVLRKSQMLSPTHEHFAQISDRIRKALGSYDVSSHPQDWILAFHDELFVYQFTD